MNELAKDCTLQQGKYKIVRTLGHGSFGITYLATTKVALSGDLGKMDVTVNVTIKEFFMEEFNSRSKDGSSVGGSSVSLVKNYRRKFHREAENLAKLHHPNIVKVLEVFDENNTTYYAMEYVDGESLDDYIKSKGRLAEPEVLSQLREIGAALKYMHDNMMLHLDLKPKNIMRNQEGHLLLIDFGLSKQYDQNGEPESSTTLGLGTPGYAPIEQANYKQDGTFPATLDIYALGATMYKMLTGTTPPHASDLLSEGFPEDMFLNFGISAETIAMVEKAMNPIKKQRFQSISELLDDGTTSNRNGSSINDFGSYRKVVGEAESETEEINDALNREHVYTRNDIEQYGISVLSFSPDFTLSIYYRGHVYAGDEISVSRLKSLSELDSVFEEVKYNLRRKNTDRIDFDSYLRKNKDVVENSFNIITYCSESDLLKLQYKLRLNPSAFGTYRIVQEMQLLPLCFDSSKDSIVSYEYQHLFCEAESGGGVVEILQAGYTEEKDDYTTETIIKKLSNFESFAYLILGSIIQYHIICKEWKNCVLLSTIPFPVKAEVWINGRYRDGFTLIEQNTCIPYKRSETISDDNCSVVILFLGKRFSINVKELFRYNPKSIEITTEIDAGTCINYVLRDKEMRKEIRISQAELFSYEVKTNNEDTIWQN